MERADEGSTPSQIQNNMTLSQLQIDAEFSRPTKYRKSGGLASVPKLVQVQHKVYESKSKGVAHVRIQNVNELLLYVKQLQVADVQALLQQNGDAPSITHTPLTDEKCVLTVNVPNSALETCGVVLLCAQQVDWISQLAGMPRQFALHMDGKYKLHHGGFILITVGTTYLKLTDRNTLSNSFVPLAYLMKAAGESEIGATHLLRALNQVAIDVAGKPLEPGETNSDHSDAFKLGYKNVFPNAPHSQCYPHIVCKFRKGVYMKKTDPNFNAALQHIAAIHFAKSNEMRDILSRQIGRQWDTWPGRPMITFWNEYCVAPWDNWSLGSFDCMLTTPNNNAQESWHKQILSSKIKGMFKSSTERMFKQALPKLMTLDTVGIPATLPFEVPAIPTAMYEKALFYIGNQHKFVRDEKNDDRVTAHTWYLLSESSSYNALTPSLLENFLAAFEGRLNNRSMHNLEKLIEPCSAVHIVRYAQPNGVLIPYCTGNPARLYCLCKSFKSVGICSHVLTISHILMLHNVKAKLQSYGVPNRSKNRGGFTKGFRPALVREDPEVAALDCTAQPEEW